MKYHIRIRTSHDELYFKSLEMHNNCVLNIELTDKVVDSFSTEDKDYAIATKYALNHLCIYESNSEPLSDVQVITRQIIEVKL